MKTTWHQPQKKERSRYDHSCRTIYQHYTSYGKIAAALQEITGDYVAAQTVRMWFRQRKIPTHYAIILTDKIGLDPFSLVPWLSRYFNKWMDEHLSKTTS